MIEESVTVLAVEEAGRAWVEAERRSACDSCSLKSGCGTGVLSRLMRGRRSRVQVIDDIGVRPGEQVVVGIPEGTMVRGSLAMYAVPLLALIAGALLGDALATGASDLAEILGGLAGMALGISWLKRYSERMSRDPDAQPRILRRKATVIQPVDGNPRVAGGVQFRQ